MNKKTIWVIAIATLLVIVIAASALVLPGVMSTRSWEAIVQSAGRSEDGTTLLTVARTSETYGDPLCALYIKEETKIVDQEGRALDIFDIQAGDCIRATLVDSSIEGNPVYYPDVRKIELIAPK